MKTLLVNLRLKFGWKAIESYVRESLAERKGLFRPFFSSEIVKFDKSTEPLIFCNDVPGLVMLLSMLRGKEMESLVEKVGIDAGIR